MTNEDFVQRVKENRKSPMTFDDYAAYFILFFPSTFLFMGFILIYNFFKFQSGIDILILAITFILIGSYSLYVFYNRVNENKTFELMELPGQSSILNIAEKMKASFRLHEINCNTDLGLIEAYTKMSVSSGGEKLTVIVDNKSVWINSRPSGGRQLISFYKDKQNINKLKQILDLRQVNV